jgi:signal transduction histidine kinase
MRLPKLLRTSTFQLALIYVMLFAGSVMILMGFMYWATVGYMARQTEETIEAEITGLAEQYRLQGLNGLVRAITERIKSDPAGSGLYLFAAPDFRPLAGNLAAWPELTPAPFTRNTRDASASQQPPPPHWVTFVREDPRGREIPARARVFTLRGDLHLLVGRDVREIVAMRALFRRALFLGLGVTIALALAGGLTMSRSTLRRLDAINQTCGRIMSGDLSLRIPTRGADDEIDRLASSVNAMLDRIEQLMDGVRHVADGIAHDLRTPLTRLRASLEELRAQTSLTDAGRAAADTALAEADSLLSTFAALLRIARIESGSVTPALVELSLDEVVRDACDLYRAVAEERGLTLTLFDQPVRVRGDRDLLFQALVNALDNAVKYTPEEGRIDVRVQPQDRHARVVIGDTGRGIPEAEREKVLQRFYRLERDQETPGSGLGLSLVHAVATMHHGTLELGDNTPGLRLVLTLPRVVEARAA